MDQLAGLTARLAGMRRPQLLVRAARFGLTDYRRDRDLRRLVGDNPLPTPVAALGHLLAAEEDAETCRRSGEVTYSVARHVELLVAVLGEARLAAAPAP
jgi:hypothetical protein